MRWFERLGTYLTTALTALAVDVAVISFLYWLFRPGWWLAYLAIKVPALAAAFAARMITYRDTMFVSVRDVQSEPAPRPPAPGDRRLSVVVPAYREADRIGGTVTAIRAALGELDRAGELEIVVVDDGSPDDTAARAEDAGADVVVRSSPNRGKGAAVRQGVLAARGRTVAFTDADLSVRARPAVAPARRRRGGLGRGGRQPPARRDPHRRACRSSARGRWPCDQPAHRHRRCSGRYRDTQCGLKAMRSDVGRLVFSHAHIDGFAFDVEVFHLVERYRLTLREVPVEVVNSTRSTVNVARDAGRLVRDLFRIRRFGRIGLYEADTTELPLRTDGVL